MLTNTHCVPRLQVDVERECAPRLLACVDDAIINFSGHAGETDFDRSISMIGGIHFTDRAVTINRRHQPRTLKRSAGS